MINQFASWMTYSVFSLPMDSRFSGAVHFFIYDTIKIFLLMAVIIFVVAVIRSYFSAEKTKKILSSKNVYVGNVLAALLGIVTPFCSCSAVPLFIGFVEAGIPLGVTFSFLVSSPMVNEVALALLFSLFGIKIALLYAGTGVFVAIVSGIIIGHLKMGKYVEDYVYQVKVGQAHEDPPSFYERLLSAKDYTIDLIKKIFPYVLFGIAVGGFIHGYAPEEFLAKYAGRGNPFAVPFSVLIGVPLYSNAAGVIPIVQALMQKGLPIGTVLAFMMAVTALSFPEAVILKKVLKWPLLITFFGIVTCAIIFVGYLFNWVL
jgi:uncharacterized membrane protein YraQ (UPF0718 family)